MIHLTSNTMCIDKYIDIYLLTEYEELDAGGGGARGLAGVVTRVVRLGAARQHVGKMVTQYPPLRVSGTISTPACLWRQCQCHVCNKSATHYF